MLTRREIVDGASFVWSVESTKWPVRRGLDRDLSRFKVSDLTDEDDIGILTQE